MKDFYSKSFFLSEGVSMSDNLIDWLPEFEEKIRKRINLSIIEAFYKKNTKQHLQEFIKKNNLQILEIAFLLDLTREIKLILYNEILENKRKELNKITLKINEELENISRISRIWKKNEDKIAQIIKLKSYNCFLLFARDFLINFTSNLNGNDFFHSQSFNWICFWKYSLIKNKNIKKENQIEIDCFDHKLIYGCEFISQTEDIFISKY